MNTDNINGLITNLADCGSSAGTVDPSGSAVPADDPQAQSRVHRDDRGELVQSASLQTVCDHCGSCFDPQHVTLQVQGDALGIGL